MIPNFIIVVYFIFYFSQDESLHVFFLFSIIQHILTFLFVEHFISSSAAFLHCFLWFSFFFSLLLCILYMCWERATNRHVARNFLRGPLPTGLVMNEKYKYMRITRPDLFLREKIDFGIINRCSMSTFDNTFIDCYRKDLCKHCSGTNFLIFYGVFNIM